MWNGAATPHWDPWAFESRKISPVKTKYSKPETALEAGAEVSTV